MRKAPRTLLFAIPVLFLSSQSHGRGGGPLHLAGAKSYQDIGLQSRSGPTHPSPRHVLHLQPPRREIRTNPRLSHDDLTRRPGHLIVMNASVRGSAHSPRNRYLDTWPIIIRLRLVGLDRSRPAAPRHFAQALRPLVGLRLFGDV